MKLYSICNLEQGPLLSWAGWSRKGTG